MWAGLNCTDARVAASEGKQMVSSDKVMKGKSINYAARDHAEGQVGAKTVARQRLLLIFDMLIII